jgi:UDP-N-acetylglucosamine--N-acetylmuramyl-(pentapeptide) pyrophosphoryl-undecaprenol N-acetylglucosamine transferase
MSIATILLAAGGTGGHLFPAEALAQVLVARDCRVELISDARVDQYAKAFPAQAVHRIAAGTVTGASLVGKLRGLVRLASGLVQARTIVKRIHPAVVVGFGGYPTVPPLLAAGLSGYRTVIHDQNAVMGRANRFLARRATAIATGFPLSEAIFPEKTVHVGNPVRARVLKAAAIPYAPPTGEGMVRILVSGGSQGARVMSDVVPPAIGALPEALRARVSVVQQARGEDEARVRSFYSKAGIEAEVAPFFADLPERVANSHLVIGRAGASTVAELAVIGRPSILVPLPGALDQDQAANARVLGDADAATVVSQPDFTPVWLAAELVRLFAAPRELEARAARASSLGIPDAAERLADLVLRVAMA